MGVVAWLGQRSFGERPPSGQFSITPTGLDATARLLGQQRWCCHIAVHSNRGSCPYSIQPVGPAFQHARSSRGFPSLPIKPRAASVRLGIAPGLRTSPARLRYRRGNGLSHGHRAPQSNVPTSA